VSPVEWEGNGKTGKGTGNEKGREERNLKGTVIEQKGRKKVGHRTNIGHCPEIYSRKQVQNVKHIGVGS